MNLYILYTFVYIRLFHKYIQIHGLLIIKRRFRHGILYKFRIIQNCFVFKDALNEIKIGKASNEFMTYPRLSQHDDTKLLTLASISFMPRPRCIGIRHESCGVVGPRISVAFTQCINVLFTHGTLQWQRIFSLHPPTLLESHSHTEPACTSKLLSNKRCRSWTTLSSRMESMSIPTVLVRILFRFS